MWAAIAIVATGALGMIWGSKHPEKPVEDLCNAVGTALSACFGKHKHKEKSNGEEE